MALAGTIKVAPVKVPLALVVAVPTLVPSKVMVTLELALKPEPFTVTVSPTPPEVGVMFMPDMVKVAVAKLPALSWALMV